MTTAREITAALRLLYPAPVRLSVRAVVPGKFRVRMPERPARDLDAGSERYSLASYLGRALSTSTAPVPVTVVGRRVIRRRDCGRDVEFAIRVGRTS